MYETLFNPSIRTCSRVGFRYFTERLALKYQIKGTVKNVEDYVEVHAQGDDASLESFTQGVINGASRLHVLKLIQ